MDKIIGYYICIDINAREPFEYKEIYTVYSDSPLYYTFYHHKSGKFIISMTSSVFNKDNNHTFKNLLEYRNEIINDILIK